MPASVLFGKDGTIFTIGGKALLATFREARITVNQDIVEHNGPNDDWEYATARRIGARMTARCYVVSSADFSLIMPPNATAHLMTCDLIDGRDFVGTFILESAEASASDDPNEFNISARSTGTFTIT